MIGVLWCRTSVATLLSFGVLIGSAGAARAATFTVTNTANSGAGSLRQAISGANGTPGTNTIDFAIGSGPQTISPTSALPSITRPVVIDGTTQPGFTSAPLIRLDGAAIPAATGLTIVAGTSTVQALQITDWATAINLRSAGANAIIGDYIGTDGTSALPNGLGVLIDKGSAGNTVGGTVAAARDVISGSSGAGVEIRDPGTQNNVVEGVYIGTNASGKNALGNAGDGVSILSGAIMNTIGGSTVAARNVISGNGTGVAISGGATAMNVVEGNSIGTNAARTAAIANGTGVSITGASASNTIGGTTSAARNLISGNTNDGVDIIASDQNQVEGNFIGTNPAGTASLPNGSKGVSIAAGAASNTIGGTTTGARNVISGNNFLGVDVAGNCRNPVTGNPNVIEGNRIGTNAGGTAAVSNFQYGVLLHQCNAPAEIGGTTAGARNIISGNGGTGVAIESDGNRVEGNYIGTDAAGTGQIGNGFGIQLSAANNNTIGGTTVGARNVISGNSSEGIRVNSQCNGNLIAGNYVGTSASGLAPVGNSTGINFYGADSSNIIGGTTPGARNVISGNGGDAVGLFNPGTTATVVEGNYIGTDKTAAGPLPNAGDGVVILTGSTNNTIGGTTAGAANIIANDTNGVHVDASSTLGHSILRNSIFANSGLGIALTSGGNNNEPAPTITSVMTSGGNTTISGAVIAGSHRIEVFQNLSCSDPEGKNFLGAVTTSTSSWSLTVPALSSPALTATSTDTSTGNTSQFSRCVTNP